MKITLQKFNLTVLNVVRKCAAATGNIKVQQDAVEKMVMLHTRMRVEQEQVANTILFSNL